MKRLFKCLDISIWMILTSYMDIQIFLTIVVTLTIINGAYFIRTRKSTKRLNSFYEYTISPDGDIYIHFAPCILFGYWADSKMLTAYRKNAITILETKGHRIVRGETMSLCKINNSQGYTIDEKLNKWSWNGICTITSTLIITSANIRTLCTLTLTRKIFLLVFRNTFNRYLYTELQT